MSIELRSLLAWLTVFFAVELCAHFKVDRWVAVTAVAAAAVIVAALWPIVTLSATIWGGIHWWHPLSDAVVVFTVVLDVHFVWMLSAGYLIAIGGGIAVAVVVHAVQLYLARR